MTCSTLIVMMHTLCVTSLYREIQVFLSSNLNIISSRFYDKKKLGELEITYDLEYVYTFVTQMLVLMSLKFNVLHDVCVT